MKRAGQRAIECHNRVTSRFTVNSRAVVLNLSAGLLLGVTPDTAAFSWTPPTAASRTVLLNQSGEFFIFQNGIEAPTFNYRSQGGNGSSGSGGGGSGGAGIGEDSTFFFGIPVTADQTGNATVEIVTQGGDGGQGHDNNTGDGHSGGAGGAGTAGTGSAGLEVTGAAPVKSFGPNSSAVTVSLVGGVGGRGGNGGGVPPFSDGNGGDGGHGGSAGSVRFFTGLAPAPWEISTEGDNSIGVEIRLTGGNAFGNRTSQSSGATSAVGDGGRGGNGGDGGIIELTNGGAATNLNISTTGSNAPAALLSSVAGFGGKGGQGDTFGKAGTGGFITVVLEKSSLTTMQDNSGFANANN